MFGSITALAVAPSSRNTIYIGTDDGNVWITRDAGHTYTRVDLTLPELWVTPRSRLVLQTLDRGLL